MVRKSSKQFYRYVVYQETKLGNTVYLKTKARNLALASCRRLTEKGISNFWTIELLPRTRK